MQHRIALITGGSSGLGAEFAAQLAQQGCDLVLVARSEDRLNRKAEALRAAHDVRVEVIPLDLTAANASQRLSTALADRGIEIDLLINNAGFATVGAFADQDAARERAEIALNVAAVVDLTHAFLPAMLARGRGAIVNVASLAGMQALPYMSVYAATKAFVLSFSTGLWAEVHDRGVHVLAVCPGPVDTPFFDIPGGSGMRTAVPRGLMADTSSVVRGSLAALADRRVVYVPGLANRAAALSVPFLPRRLLARATARVMHRR
ncbi:MAG TPA: SDR family oxidoreductase [Nevskiaceae bacterium]|nr:SDR family oxidoreductase [Nevskiaceae bacterium]